jgi:hypothetical protein
MKILQLKTKGENTAEAPESRRGKIICESFIGEDEKE